MIEMHDALADARRVTANPRREGMRLSIDATAGMAKGLIALDALARTTLAFLAALDAAYDADQRRDVVAANEARQDARACSANVITELARLGYIQNEECQDGQEDEIGTEAATHAAE